MPARAPARLNGPRWRLDPFVETLTNDPDANRLLTRKYRKSFVVPNEIS